MIAARSIHRISDADGPLRREASRALIYSLLLRPQRIKNMDHIQQNEEAPLSESNFRAEDGPATGRSNSLYEGVVVPLASLFAVFLFMLGAMVITR
jgi:hypothetical protein